MDEADDTVAPGGWRRAALGFLLGLAAGAVVALLLPRDDGPRRRSLTVDPVAPVPLGAGAAMRPDPTLGRE